MFYKSSLSNMEPHVGLLRTWNVASETGDLNLSFDLILMNANVYNYR